MYRKAVNYLRGQAVAEVVCTAPERVVNLCAAHGIPFWDLTWLTETSFRVTTTLSGARRLAEVTADIGAQVTVCRKSGAPELWRRCRHRYVLLGAALVLPLLLQPALAALSDADSRWTSRRLALVLSLLTLAAAVVMTVSTGSKTVLVAAYAVIGVLLVSTSPFFNSMVMEYHLRGVNVNYGLGRGTGSTTYAIVALLLGFVLEKRAPTVILPVLLAALVLQIIAVWTFRYPLPPVPAAQEEEPPKVLGLWALLKKYPAFPVMLMGCALLQGGHNACNTYMIHIVDKVGAGESLMGVVLAVSAFMELPAMTLFSRMRQKLSLRGMFLLCAAAFVAKDVLFLLARTPTLLYVSAALQFFEFGVFLPATVYYAAETLDAANQAKGQGLIHIFSNGVGPAVMTAVSGTLVDRVDVNAMLLFNAAAAVVGLLVVAFATSGYFDKRSKEK